MAFKWTDRVDGQDAVLADDVNTLAAGIKENIDNLTAHKNMVIIDHPDGSITHEKLADGIIENNNISDGAVSKTKLSNELNTTIDLLIKKAFPETPTSWEDVQQIVRAGEASNVFSIGEQLVCNHETYGNLTWDIIGFDHDTPSNSQYKHSMTLQMHDLWTSAMQYDAPEAMYYIDEATYPNGLDAGTYCFTLPNYDATYGGGSTLNFTLANPVPVGGQIRFAWGYKVQANTCKISTYETVGAATAIETVTVAEGEAGIALPALHDTEVIENANCAHRIKYGSNNWAESALRQWLNTDAEGNAWWEPKSVFDRPSSNVASAGFLKGLDPAFLNVIGEVTKTTQQSISDGYGLNVSTERFFLLSRPEIYAGAERSADGAGGTVYAYYGAGYSDLTAPGTGEDTNRIKYRNGPATYWWLRTPDSTYGNRARLVSPTGSLSNGHALDSYGVAPACCIV